MTPLVGRDRELARLLELHQRVAAGEAATVVVQGEAGIGKSRLMAELARTAETAGSLVLSGGCPPIAGRDLPLAPLLAALRSFMRGASEADVAALEPARSVLGALVPSISTGGSGQSTADAAAAPGAPVTLGLVFEHVLGVLERLAAGRPAVVLILEDLHWAAPSTWDLVAYLTRNLVRARVLLACTYREDALLADPRDALVLAELVRTPEVTKIRLGPLEAAEAAELAAALAPGQTAASRATLVARADGNPYLIGELAAAGGSALPESIRASVEARLAALPEPVLRVLRSAALIGRRFEAELLLAVVGEPPDATIAALRAAVRAGFLESGGGPDGDADAFVFVHEVEREVVEGGLVAGERSRLHGRIARALASRGTEDSTPERVIELATHWRASEEPLRAVPALIRAAGTASSMYAFVEAYRLYEQAFGIAREAITRSAARGIGFRMTEPAAPGQGWDSGPEWADLFARAAEAASLAGYADRAIELVDAALGHPAPPSGAVPAWTRRRARYLLEAGRTAAAVEAYEALEQATGDVQPEERTRILLAHAQALSTAGRFLESARLGESALELARTHARSLEWQALQVVGAARVQGGETEAGLAMLGDARALAARRVMDSVIRPRASRVGEVLFSQLDAARAMASAGRGEGAMALAAESAADAARLGAVRWRGELDVQTAWQQLRLGDWAAAAATSEQVLAADPPAAIHAEALLVRGELRALTGRDAEAEVDLQAAIELVEVAGRPDLAARLALVEALQAAARRRHNDAIRAAEAGLAALGPTEDRALRTELCLAGLRASIELALDAAVRRVSGEALAQREAADRWLGELRAVAGTSASGSRGAALVRLAEAERTRLEGDGTAGRDGTAGLDGVGDRDGVAAWGDAVSAAEAAGDRYLAAAARFRLAEALLSGREGRSAAADNLRAAHSVAMALGAEPLRGEIEALASRARIDVAVSEPPPPTPASPGSGLGLSEREIEVLALLAAGRTNRQIASELFITEKTAGHHVSNILSKLGVANRLEAAAIAHRTGVSRFDGPAGPEGRV
jgi:DNA-binding CsgD family transcriptional regulator/tetratricopeptide (TPR) repeat protein